MQTAPILPTREHRRCRRAPLRASTDYRDATGERSAATIHNVGLGGMGLTLGRYLRPGTRLMLDMDRAELKAEVAAGRRGATQY